MPLDRFGSQSKDSMVAQKKHKRYSRERNSSLKTRFDFNHSFRLDLYTPPVIEASVHSEREREREGGKGEKSVSVSQWQEKVNEIVIL